MPKRSPARSRWARASSKSLRQAATNDGVPAWYETLARRSSSRPMSCSMPVVRASSIASSMRAIARRRSSHLNAIQANPQRLSAMRAGSPSVRAIERPSSRCCSARAKSARRTHRCPAVHRAAERSSRGACEPGRARAALTSSSPSARVAARDQNQRSAMPKRNACSWRAATLQVVRHRDPQVVVLERQPFEPELLVTADQMWCRGLGQFQIERAVRRRARRSARWHRPPRVAPPRTGGSSRAGDSGGSRPSSRPAPGSCR